jgi:hypothetical protein
MEDHAFIGLVETIDRANRHAGRIIAMHACHRDRTLAGATVIDRHQATAVHAPGHFVFILAGCRTAIALDAALCITDKFHSCHDLFSLSV